MASHGAKLIQFISHTYFIHPCSGSPFIVRERKNKVFEQPGECVQTTQFLARDVNHCLSQESLHKTAHHLILHSTVLRDNGTKER